MTIEPVPEQPEYVAVVVCAQCPWSLSMTSTTALGNLANTEELEEALAHHKQTLHPERTNHHA